MTIVLILVALAVIAYYADLFGWDPNDRFDGPKSSGIGPSLLFLLVGLSIAFHFDLVTLDVFDDKISHGSQQASHMLSDIELPSAADASKQISNVFGQLVAEFQATAQAVSEAVGSPEATASVRTPPPSS